MRQRKKIFQCIIGGCIIMLWIFSTYKETIAEKNKEQQAEKVTEESVQAEPMNAPEEITTWTDFCNAFHDPYVEEIRLGGPIEKGTSSQNLEPLGRNLTIIGNGNTLNLGNVDTNTAKIRLGAAGQETTLRMENLTYVYGGANLIDTTSGAGGADWTVELHDVRSGTASNNRQPALTNSTSSSLTVVLSGEKTEIETNTGDYGIYARDIMIAEKAEMKLKHSARYSLYAYNKLTVEAEALVTIEAISNSAYVSAGIFAKKVELDKGAALDLELKQYTKNTNGTHGIIGIQDLHVGEGADLKIYGPEAENINALIYFSTSTGGSILTEKDSVLELRNEGTSCTSFDDQAVNACGIYGAIADLKIGGGSTVTINTTAVAFRTTKGIQTFITDQVWKEGGFGQETEETKVSIWSRDGICFAAADNLIDYYNKSIKVDFKIHGEKTKVEMVSEIATVSMNNYVFAGYVMMLRAGSGGEFGVSGGASLKVEHKVTGSIKAGGGIKLEDAAPVMSVTDGSEVEVVTAATGWQATEGGIKLEGKSSLYVDNGTVKVFQKIPDLEHEGSLQDAGITLSQDGEFYVSNGGKVDIVLETSPVLGNKTGNSNGYGCGIYFNGANSTGKFSVSGEGSEVNIEAGGGAAIMGFSNRPSGPVDVNIKVTDGASFRALGNPSTDFGVFNSKYGLLNIDIEDASYFDFAYTGKDNKKMSNLFVCENNSSLTIKNSRLSFWKKGRPLSWKARR